MAATASTKEGLLDNWLSSPKMNLAVFYHCRFCPWMSRWVMRMAPESTTYMPRSALPLWKIGSPSAEAARLAEAPASAQFRLR